MGMDYSLVQRIIDGLGKILDTKPGSPDEGTYVTEQQLADWIKGQTVVPAYYYSGVMYSDALHTTPITGQAGALYIDQDNNVLYRWDGAAWDAMNDKQLRQDILDGTVVAKKAECDEDGNNIKATYATKSDASDLQSQIVNINSEVDNIEALIGDEAQVENLDDTPMVVQSRLIHHANLLPNGEFGRVGARELPWIQVIDASTQINSATVGAGEINGITITYDSTTHKFHATGTATVNYDKSILRYIPLTVRHKYFLNANNIADGSSPSIKVYGYGNSVIQIYNGERYTANSTGEIAIYFYVTSGTYVDVYFSVYMIDLTIMNKASLLASELRSLFPASYYPYDTGHLYDLNPSGFRIRGVNLWDEEWEVGTISSSNGADTVNAGRIRSVGYTDVSPMTTYYFHNGSSTRVELFFYDANKNFLRADDINYGSTFTTQSGEVYMRFSPYTAYGSTYKGDLQIADNTLPTSVKTVYHAYDGHVIDTPQIADGHYVNENCFDYVENVAEDGIVKGKKHIVVGSVDLGTLNWYAYSSGNTGTYYTQLNEKKLGTNNGLCVAFVQSGYGTETRLPDNSFCFRSGAIIFFRDSAIATADAFKTAMNGVMLYYELATEVVTDCEPLRPFDISDYSTVEPITPQDELVNRIDVPYSVKTVSANVLIEQVRQNTADIANLNNALTAIDHRLDNLEQPKGGYVVSNYKDGSVTPSGKGDWAVVEGLRGVSRCENNLLSNGDFASTTDWSFSSSTFSVSDNVATVTPTGSNGQIAHNYTFITGHTYLVFADIKLSSANATTRILAVSEPTVSAYAQSNTNWQQVALVCTVTSGGNGYVVARDNSGQSAFSVRNFVVTDLTLYFGGTIPSDADTIAEIQQNYPHLLTPSDYGVRIVDSSYSGVRAWARNIWDEEWDNGTIDSSGNNASGLGVRSKNYIPVVPSGTYYFLTPIEKVIAIAEYDADKNFIKFIYASGDIKTVENNCFYIRFYVLGTEYTSYANDICINQSDSQNGTYTPYHAPNTLSLTFQGKSAGSVYDSCEPNVEVGGVAKKRETQRIGTIDASTLEWSSPTNTYRYLALVSDAKTGAGSMLAGYLPANGSTTMASGTCGFNVAQKYFYIADESCTTTDALRAKLAGRMLNYELADPVVTLSDPILDNTLLTESGGRMATVQTGTVVDGSFDLGFINL